MTNQPDTRTVNMVHHPNKDATDPRALDEYLDAIPVGAIDATGTANSTTYLRGDGAWATVSGGGGGDVTKVGTPVDGQIGVWTGDGTIEGDSALTFDTTDDTLVIGASGKLAFGAVDILSDSAGTTTLQNIDAIDATTEATIAAALAGDFVDGTGADNQVAVWVDSDTIEGGSDLTFDGTSLKVGSGDSGATVSTGADDLLIETSATADLGITISDGGTASKHSIQMRTSDDKFAEIFANFDVTDTSDYGLRITFNDGTNEQSIEFDNDREEMQFFGFAAPDAGGGGTLLETICDFVFWHGRSDGGLRLIHDTDGSSRFMFGTATVAAQGAIGFDSAAATDYFFIQWDGTTRMRFLRNLTGATMLLRESPNAPSSTTGFGGFWVENTAPCVPKFTDDASNNYTIVLDTKTQTLTNKTIVAANNTLTLWEQHADNPKASTSGTALDWTGIPDNVQEIVVSFVGVSTNGTSPYIIQLGDSGGIETSGYTSRVRGTGTSTNATAGFIVTTANHAAADVLYGEARISRVNAGLGWTCTSSTVGNSRLFVASGYKAVSATLDRIRLTTVGGTDTFDAGSVSVKFI